jgi:steroid delta-isomerase-like uncharacterized protein
MCSATRIMLVLITCIVALGGSVPMAAADTEANKATFLRVLDEAWSGGQFAVIDEVVALGFVYHEPALGDIPGPEGLKQTIMGYRMAYPDLKFTSEEMIAEGDLVAMRWTARGTQNGELMGIPATGLATTSVGINIACFDADGKMVEQWSSWDVLGLMQQLGAVQPGRPGPENYLWDTPSDLTGDPGTLAENKLLVLRVKSQFWNGKDIAGLDETHLPSAFGNNPAIIGPATYEAYREACVMYQTVFPDFHQTTDAIFAEGDKVVVRWTATGTQQGELLGMPASGKQVKYSGITIYRVADGKIAESWWAYDVMGLVQQITSPPEQSAAGVWVLSVPTPMGTILMLHNNQAQDTTGTRFGGTVLHVNDNANNFGMFPDVDTSTGWVSQTVRTGPDTFASTMLEYGTKRRENAPDELMTIGISTSTWQITGSDTKEGQATYAVYLASQDADGDGFPDEGEEPVSCTPFTFTGRRLWVMPDCELTALPEQDTQ